MFSGKTRGVKAEMYAINKAQQRREWQLLKHACRIREVPLSLPDPTTTKISVKRWDKLEAEQITALGWTLKKFWRIKAGESEYRKNRFISLYTAFFADKTLPPSQ